MDDEQKLMIISSVINLLVDDFFTANGTHAELDELASWFEKKWPTFEDIQNLIISKGHPQQDLLLKKIDTLVYPNFWMDFWEAIQQTKIQNPLRPERNVT